MSVGSSATFGPRVPSQGGMRPVPRVRTGPAASLEGRASVVTFGNEYPASRPLRGSRIPVDPLGPAHRNVLGNRDFEASELAFGGAKNRFFALKNKFLIACVFAL